MTIDPAIAVRARRAVERMLAVADAMTVPPLPPSWSSRSVRAALLEDLGRAGDITTDAIVPADARAESALVARQPGVVAGLDCALTAFRLIDPAIDGDVERPDGSRLAPGDSIAAISGPARGILTAERTALNFLCHLSRRRLRDARHRRCDRRAQGAGRLHAQDHARAARRAEIRGARRRRLQSPLRPG